MDNRYIYISLRSIGSKKTCLFVGDTLKKRLLFFFFCVKVSWKINKTSQSTERERELNGDQYLEGWLVRPRAEADHPRSEEICARCGTKRVPWWRIAVFISSEDLSNKMIFVSRLFLSFFQHLAYNFSAVASDHFCSESRNPQFGSMISLSFCNFTCTWKHPKPNPKKNFPGENPCRTSLPPSVDVTVRKPWRIDEAIEVKREPEAKGGRVNHGGWGLPLGLGTGGRMVSDSLYPSFFQPGKYAWEMQVGSWWRLFDLEVVEMLKI